MSFATDKVSLGYLPTYYGLAEELGPAARVIEVGVLDGGSLEMWQSLFPNGTVVGVDRNYRSRWPEGTVRVVAAQDDAELPAMVAEHGPFDLVVDDASHEGALTRRTWELLWPLVAPGRYYVIEDWQVAFWPDRDDSMLRMAESLLPTLDGTDVDCITYRHGQIILRKKATP